MTNRNRNIPAVVPRISNISLRDEWLTPLDRIFDEAFTKLFPDAIQSGIARDPFQKSSYPKVNVLNYDGHIEIHAELAGFTKDDVSIEIEENKLIISGQSSIDSDDSTPTFIIHELSRAKFRRTFVLDMKQLDASTVDASFENGILIITIDKREIEKPKKKVIDIR